MKNMTVLISGASVAGPALAYWLRRYGATVTVVEKTTTLRTGGQAVDFKGTIHRTVLERMGILDEVRNRQTGGRDVTVIDAKGRKKSLIPGDFTGGEIEIRRGDLSELLYERTADDCEYIFGDSITALTETANGVHVTFERTAPRTFDIVVGADGIHSNVRRLVFGPESDYVRHLGYYYALADLPGIEAKGDAVMYNEPGRKVTIGGLKSQTFFVFASPELTYDRYDSEQQQKLLVDAYRGGGWRLPELMAKVPGSDNFYLDSLSRVTIDRYSQGRVVLLGDSAYGNTLGGFGTGQAVVGAYVLAGELMAANGDHRTAFARYEQLFRRYTKGSERSSAGPFLAPPTKARIWLRNLMFRSSLLLKLMMRMTDDFATDIELVDYPAQARG